MEQDRGEEKSSTDERGNQVAINVAINVAIRYGHQRTFEGEMLDARCR